MDGFRIDSPASDRNGVYCIHHFSAALAAKNAGGALC